MRKFPKYSNYPGAKGSTLSALLLSALLGAFAAMPAMAWGSVDIKLGKGEELQAKKGFFGNEKFAIQDRMGDHVEKSRGIFGNKHEEVSVMGNGASYNRGIFGINKSISGGDMLGDKFESHKMLFGLGPRITKVDVSGATGIAEHLITGGLSGASGIGGLGAAGGMGGSLGGPMGGVGGGQDLSRFSPLRGYRGKLPDGANPLGAGAGPGAGFNSGGMSSDGKPMPADLPPGNGGGITSGFPDVNPAPNQNVPFSP